MSWYVAHSLDQLLAEINASAPGRNKASDGSIGDANHSNSTSDHNPCDCHDAVCARDFTHDPGGGFDSYAFAQWLAERTKGPEARVKYVISNGMIASGQGQSLPRPGVWRPYSGLLEPPRPPRARFRPPRRRAVRQRRRLGLVGRSDRPRTPTRRRDPRRSPGHVHRHQRQGSVCAVRQRRLRKFKDWTSYTEVSHRLHGSPGAAHRRDDEDDAARSWLWHDKLLQQTAARATEANLMLNVIWTSPNSAEILFLVAAIVAFVYAVLVVLNRDVIDALVPVAICLVALGLLAL